MWVHFSFTGGSNCGKNVKYFSRPFYCQGGSNMVQYCNAEEDSGELLYSRELRTRYWQLQVHWPQDKKHTENFDDYFSFEPLEKSTIIMTHFSSSRLENLSKECDSLLLLLHLQDFLLVSNSTLMSLKWPKSRFDFVPSLWRPFKWK